MYELSMGMELSWLWVECTIPSCKLLQLQCGICQLPLSCFVKCWLLMLHPGPPGRLCDSCCVPGHTGLCSLCSGNAFPHGHRHWAMLPAAATLLWTGRKWLLALSVLLFHIPSGGIQEEEQSPQPLSELFLDAGFLSLNHCVKDSCAIRVSLVSPLPIRHVC